MAGVYIEDRQFEHTDFTLSPLEKGSYESCIFKGCNFSSTDLSEFIFCNCEFIESNLSLVNLTKTVLQDTKFTGCKLLGLQFDSCSDFGLSLSFKNCQLDHSVFYKKKIKEINFTNTQLREVDFTEADLSQAVFENCDLLGATFEFTNLEKADFRTAHNFSINPESNRIRKAKFTLMGLPGLLNKFDLMIE